PCRAADAAVDAHLVKDTQLLANELHDTGVHLQVLCPGTVEAEFHTVQGIDLTRMPVAPLAAEDVVQASLAGLRLGEVVCVPGLDNPDALEALRAAELGVFEHSRGNVLADRYAGVVFPGVVG